MFVFECVRAKNGQIRIPRYDFAALAIAFSHPQWVLYPDQGQGQRVKAISAIYLGCDADLSYCLNGKNKRYSPYKGVFGVTHNEEVIRRKWNFSHGFALMWVQNDWMYHKERSRDPIRSLTEKDDLHGWFASPETSTSWMAALTWLG